jgi:hypothetical protein
MMTTAGSRTSCRVPPTPRSAGKQGRRVTTNGPPDDAEKQQEAAAAADLAAGEGDTIAIARGDLG